MEAFSLVRAQQVAARPETFVVLVAGDFAVGSGSEGRACVRGDYASGARTLGEPRSTGDFATGCRRLSIAALSTGSFATGARVDRRPAQVCPAVAVGAPGGSGGRVPVERP